MILLHLVSLSNANFNQRAGIYLLNNLACQVDTDLKVLLSRMGAVETILQLIYEKLKLVHSDYVMETAWSALWNVTDESPVNCERFLTSDGLTLFIKCKVTVGVVTSVFILFLFREGSPTNPHCWVI